jgi:hypothetical protein
VPLVTVLAVLTYPPVGGLLLIAALVHLRDRPWREVLLVVATFLAGFGIGTGVVFSAAVAARGGDPAREVVFRQEPAQRRTGRGRITEGTLRMMFYEEAGVVVRWCRATECTRLDQLADQGPVHDLGTVVGVVVPSPPAVL